MFGKDNDEIVEIKTGLLKAFYIDQISQNRVKTNRINSSSDITITLLTDASEQNFKNLFEEFMAEHDEFHRFKFQKHLSKNGFYSFTINPGQHMVPGQKL